MYYGPAGDCQEICGDNLNFGLLDCDDGNMESGDGCSPLCEVEEGWVCKGGSRRQGDTCQPLRTQMVRANSTDWNQLVIEFDKDVMVLGELMSQ